MIWIRYECLITCTINNGYLQLFNCISFLTELRIRYEEINYSTRAFKLGVRNGPDSQLHIVDISLTALIRDNGKHQ